MKDATRVVRAGLPQPQQGEPFLPGPVFAAPFHLSGDPTEADYVYGRYGNPTWTRYEEALGELEGGQAVLFASGMAACTAVLMTSLRPGDIAVVQPDCYMHVRGLAEGHLAERGVEVRLEAGSRPAGAKLVWIETPSNPRLEVYDVAALADAAHSEGALVAVDNTTATPLAQRPLGLGADLSVASATKHLGGHADLVLGYVATRDVERAERLRRWRTETGALAGPFEAWLAHRSLATLELRLERSCANARALAELLAARDDVSDTRYPGLADDPGHQVAARQMSRFGTIVSFDLGGRERAERFLAASKLVTEATSFGGLLTTAERRGRWPAEGVPEGFIRLSAGCEGIEDLLADVEAALSAE